MTSKQELFCKYYAESMNASAAAVQAGYSEKSAYSQGSRLLKKDEIQKKIAEEIEMHNSDLPDMKELNNLLKRFWYEVMTDESEKTSVRLAASTNLAKSIFMFNADISGWE